MEHKRHYVILRTRDEHGDKEKVIRSFSKRADAIVFVTNKTYDCVVTYWRDLNNDIVYKVNPRNRKETFMFIIRTR